MNETNSVYFTVYYHSNENGTNWEPLNSFDYNTTNDIKVLNIHPDKSLSSIPNATFNFLDTSTEPITTYLSASLKVWMKGGYYVYEEENYSFEPYEANPYINEQIIHVDLMNSKV